MTASRHSIACIHIHKQPCNQTIRSQTSRFNNGPAVQLRAQGVVSGPVQLACGTHGKLGLPKCGIGTQTDTNLAPSRTPTKQGVEGEEETALRDKAVLEGNGRTHTHTHTHTHTSITPYWAHLSPATCNDGLQERLQGRQLGHNQDLRTVASSKEHTRGSEDAHRIVP
jgi:hypothetical protein